MSDADQLVDKVSIDRKLLQYASTIVSDHRTQHLTEHTRRIFVDSDRLMDLASKWQNCAEVLTQGRMFEQLEVIKYNLDSLGKGAATHAVTSDALGDPHAFEDILIRKGKKVLREVQAKSCDNAAQSVFALSNPKYREMDRLLPKDQHVKAEDLLDERIGKGTLKSEDYVQTKRHLKGELSHGDVSSGGTTRQEALDATKIETATDMASDFKCKGVLGDIHHSGMEAARVSGAVAGGFSAAGGLFRIAHGEATVGETLAKVTMDAACGAVVGYVTTAASKGLLHGFGKCLSECSVKVIAKSNAHIAIATGFIQSCKSVTSYLKGDIEEEEMLSEVSHTAITGATAFYYGALGQIVIPIPVVGALVGSTVGYYIGNMLHQSGLVSLGECATVKTARLRRERIHDMTLTAIPLMRAKRLELEQLINNHIAERKAILLTSMDTLEMSMLQWDPLGFIHGLENICQVFSAHLPFMSFEEFDSFMQDRESVFIL